MKQLLVLCIAVLAFSCGETKKEDNYNVKKEAVVEKEAPKEAVDPNVAIVVIEGNDQMKYNTDEIRVKAGQTVKLTLKHVGKMKKEVMGHNWVLLTQGADVAAIGQAGAVAADNDYIPADMTDMIITYTKMIGGGESVTIEFEAPAQGTYDFLCTFPGHYALMKGKFIVE